MGLAIVAIPEEQDRVWRISSEKVPHLTLLFLGDAENADTQQIVQFVEHAVALSEHGQFYLDVDRRDTLGEDEADVLLFSKRSWNLKWIKQFRGQLLQNQAIRTAYDSTDQFEEWLPHLTLGYPETPANKLDDDRDDYPIYSVAFDRIAVWEDDSEGPEFRLEWPDRPEEFDGPMAVAWADEQKKALKHYGVKGMRWGQRKTETTVSGKKVTPKKLAKLDKKFEKQAMSPTTFLAIHNRAAELANKHDIDRINNKPEYKDVNFAKLGDDHPTTQKYYKEHAAAFETRLGEAGKEFSNASGSRTLEAKVITDRDGLPAISIKPVDREKVKHADESQEVIYRLVRDAKGVVTKFEPVESEMAQTAGLGEEFIEHYGVKGMRWGQRNASGERGGLRGRSDARKKAVADRKERGVPAKGTARAAVGNKVKSGAKALGRGIKRAANALDEHFYETSIYSSVTHEAIHNDVAREIDSKVYKLQSAPKYRGKNLKTDKALETEYHQDVAKVTDSAYRRAVKDHIGENTKGTKEARYVDDARGARIEIRDKQTGEVRREADLTPDNGIQTDRLDHAATAPIVEPNITIPLKLDANGQIKAVGYVEPKEASAEHSVADVGAAFIIEHYGIKGMRWGFRRETPTAVSPTATSRVPHGNRRKTKVETEGGQNHPAHEDAIKVAEAKVKLKKSGTAALSNKELQDVANRVQLEERVKLLTSSKGKRFVKSELENEGKNIAKGVAKKGAKKGAKKVATAALLA